jgi:hypothetical protein
MTGKPRPLHGDASIPQQHSVLYIPIGQTDQWILMDFRNVRRLFDCRLSP